MNTAVSTTWGFPDPSRCSTPPIDPETGAAKPCYDCRRWECLCFVPDGFCDNLLLRHSDKDIVNDPAGSEKILRKGADFLIDYVRVYQDLSV